jgi:hypothetical protein
MVVFSCGDGRPREPALSEVEGSKPSAARQRATPLMICHPNYDLSS